MRFPRILGAAVVLLFCSCDDSETVTTQDGGVDASVDTRSTDGATDGKSTDAPNDAVGDFSPDACVPRPVDCNNRCGPVSDNCGGKHRCGGCGEGLVCNIDTNQCGSPLITCEDLLAECGTLRNACGIHIACGGCPDGQECNPDTNTCIPCVEVTCENLGRQCGSSWLGCGPATNLTDCGNCPAGQVCNAPYHICEPDCEPASTTDICAAAKTAKGVECGVITDGCGGVADCGACPAGEACGVQGIANRCSKKETPLECALLGRNCGTIESACGETLDCGICPGGEVCNSNGVCGPACDPKSCDKELAGVCGTQLDDGCLGFIDCGCDAGLSCNSTNPAVAGTCEALKICTDHGANGKAGDPCSNEPSPTFPRGDGQSLSCPCEGAGVCVVGQTVVSGPDAGTCCLSANSCSTAGGACVVTDTCTGKQLDCCTNEEFCDPTTNTCKLREGCPESGCSNGPAFDDGSGTLITCACSDGALCVANGAEVSGSQTGTCCMPADCSGTDACTVPNGCINETVNCCSVTEFCDSATQTCQPLGGCSPFAGQCSNGPAFDRGDGTLLTCPCSGGQLCVAGGAVVSGSEVGSCCTLDQCTGNVCSIPNNCISGWELSCCTGGQYCDSATNTCQTLKNCSSYSGCSNGAAFDRGDGTMLTCPCSGGQLCVAGGAVVSGSQVGSCCTLNQCSGNVCSIPNNCISGQTIDCCSNGYCVGGVCTPFKTCADYPNQCSNGAAFDRGDGTMFSCGCGSGQVCVDAVPGSVVSGTQIGTCCSPGSCPGGSNEPCAVANGCVTGAPDDQCCASNEFCNSSTICERKKTCSYYTERRLGDDCSDMDSSAFPDGSGDNLDCPCRTGGGFNNIECVGDSANSAGTCECTARTCKGDCRLDGQSDYCGGTLSCGCTGGDVCNPTNGQCCDPKTCADYPGECGSLSNGCGGTISCGCSGGQVCNPGTGQCCTPLTCTDHPGECGSLSNGCGGTISCGCSGGQVCHNGSCCTKETCTSYPSFCGTRSDTCGGSISCTCSSPQVCNPSTSQCCTASSCGGGDGDACGSNVDNGCGGTMTCGCTAQPWLSCINGSCGCVPDSCGSGVGDPCGSVDNGCGGTMSCGCSGSVCYNGACCQPKTCADYPGECGSKPDGCGGNTASCQC